MPKLSPKPITKKDLNEFLKDYSDFGFELHVLNALIRDGFACEHSGTYDDPVTQKPRQFDIRATRRFGKYFLRLAVECKNLNDSCPLLISCVPRAAEESFHEISYSVNPDTHAFEQPSTPYTLASLPRSRSVRLRKAQSIYSVGAAVGKSCDQVGRAASGEISAGSSDVYEKWAQALSSAHDLTYLACSDGDERTLSFAMAFVIPIVVVPNDRLWMALFDSGGAVSSEPAQVDRCSYYVARSYVHQSIAGGEELTLSHLEFVTVRGLHAFTASLCENEGAVRRTFPLDTAREILRHHQAT